MTSCCVLTAEAEGGGGAAGPRRLAGQREPLVPGRLRRDGRVTARGVERSQRAARLPQDAARPEHRLPRERRPGTAAAVTAADGGVAGGALLSDVIIFGGALLSDVIGVRRIAVSLMR